MKVLLSEDFLQQEMTRKQFLQYMGAVIVAVLGLNNLISVLVSLKSQPETFTPPTPSTDASKSFGTRKFGA